MLVLLLKHGDPALHSVEKKTLQTLQEKKYGYIRFVVVMEKLQISICGTNMTCTTPFLLMQEAKNNFSQNCAVTWIKMLLQSKRKQARARVNQGYKYRSLGTLRS